ncbi:hypothetical protein Micbo1qcDRAFT_29706 [Microdochium bolleyi]|uniref:BZIP domain-containing protein n=1 Tax=Microdochium bolleyi TaxID=196109 RepID=A0A136JFK7_9PEZI|nr:hypothetical protein Micbo1qcDRAFT_29706 [Microdochium bolleyi]
METPRTGVGSHADLPLGDTQQMFEEYWQHGKYSGQPVQSGGSSRADPGAGARSQGQPRSSSVNAGSSSEEPGGSIGGGGSSEATTTLTKAQARRAQVRRAQIQHRQRKADYTKHLEMETAKFRDMIDKTMRETYALEAENETMRQMLMAKLGYLPAEALHITVDSKQVTRTSETAISDDAMVWEADGGLVVSAATPGRSNSSSSIATPLYSVSIGLSDVMGTPAMQVRRTSSPRQMSADSGTASIPHTPRTGSVSQTPSAASASHIPRTGSTSQASRTSSISQAPPSRNTPQASQGGVHLESIPAFVQPADIITSLSEEQTDQAINFILGLEHICWDHWDRSYFTHQQYDETGCMHGHALMASTIALQAAPVEVFNQLDAVGEYLRSNPLQQHDRSEHGHCEHGAMTAAHVPSDMNMTQSLRGEGSRASSSLETSMASQTPGTSARSAKDNVTLSTGPDKQSPQSAQPQISPASGIPMLQDNNISWPATGLSLETLHALASKLSPPETELAPVQAWFEILRGYGTAVVLNQQLMARVLAEFSGVVKCLHFGAVIERDAFDSVLSRVIGGAQWA